MSNQRSCEVAIVDDDHGVLESLRFMLETAGYTVATYPSALAYLADLQEPPRCLILDHHMPVMTGLDLVTKLHATDLRVPVLLITAAPSAAIVARAAEIGVTRVLEKPPTETELIAFVEDCA
jgi:two-component system, LuxR family, response regulator FixJ